MLPEPEDDDVEVPDAVASAPGEPTLDLNIPAPRALKAGGLFKLLKPGGIGPLLSRLAWEDRFGDRIPDPLTAPEIVRLIDAYADEPLPPQLRRLVIRHLEGRVKRRPGRKRAKRSTIQQIQEHILPVVYEEELAAARKEVRRRRAEAKATRRGPSPKSIPPATELAADKVRQALPLFRQLTTPALLNLVSKKKTQT